MSLFSALSYNGSSYSAGNLILAVDFKTLNRPYPVVSITSYSLVILTGCMKPTELIVKEKHINVSLDEIRKGILQVAPQSLSSRLSSDEFEDTDVVLCLSGSVGVSRLAAASSSSSCLTLWLVFGDSVVWT